MSITLDQFEDRLRDAARAGGLHALLLRELRVEALKAEAEAKVNFRKTHNSPTGKLRESIEGVVRDADTGAPVLAIGVGSRTRQGPPYGRIQELGGTVRPVRAKMLTIPLDAAKKPAGSAKIPSPLRTHAPDKFFLWKSPRTGKLFLRDRITGVPWYILVRQSTIPARPYLRPAAEAAGERLIKTLGTLASEALGAA